MPLLTRDCPATAIPAGTSVVLAAGEQVAIAQDLGGSLTVRTPEGLFRIENEHAEAIEGRVTANRPAASGVADEFSEQAVWEALRSCFDPEIPVNIVDLGLVYDLAVETGASGGHRVDVKMTLTAQGCGMGPVIAEDARKKIASLPSVESANVHIVWDPVWTPHMISPEGRKKLGLE